MNKELREDLEHLIICNDKTITQDLRDDVKMTLDYIDELENKIDKAIEYINKYNKTINYQQELGMYREFMIIPKELLDILRGEDNE